MIITANNSQVSPVINPKYQALKQTHFGVLGTIFHPI